ncbi:MAG: hypothetical protein KatS3mg055_3611 [Chloroflexus sp.]|nr:MAG: hypothetical protein KatS3mg055_3611 [Chloroflexus sp.]
MGGVRSGRCRIGMPLPARGVPNSLTSPRPGGNRAPPSPLTRAIAAIGISVLLRKILGQLVSPYLIRLGCRIRYYLPGWDR